MGTDKAVVKPVVTTCTSTVVMTTAEIIVIKAVTQQATCTDKDAAATPAATLAAVKDTAIAAEDAAA